MPHLFALRPRVPCCILCYCVVCSLFYVLIFYLDVRMFQFISKFTLEKELLGWPPPPCSTQYRNCEMGFNLDLKISFLGFVQSSMYPFEQLQSFILTNFLTVFKIPSLLVIYRRSSPAKRIQKLPPPYSFCAEGGGGRVLFCNFDFRTQKHR